MGWAKVEGFELCKKKRKDEEGMESNVNRQPSIYRIKRKKMKKKKKISHKRQKSVLCQHRTKRMLLWALKDIYLNKKATKRSLCGELLFLFIVPFVFGVRLTVFFFLSFFCVPIEH